MTDVVKRDEEHARVLSEFKRSGKKPPWLEKFLAGLESLGAVGTHVSAKEDHFSMLTLAGQCACDDVDQACVIFRAEMDVILNCSGSAEMELRKGWACISWSVDGDAAAAMRA